MNLEEFFSKYALWFYLLIFFGIPSIFLLLIIINVEKIAECKYNKEKVKKSTVIQVIIFTLIFVAVAAFEMWWLSEIAKSIAANM